MVLSTRKRKKGGMSKGTERKLKSRANWTACFLRASLTAQCGWLCLSLFLSLLLPLSVSTSLSLSDYLVPGGGERGRQRGKEGEEEASFHGDDWWKRTRQVLLGCTPLLFLSVLSLFSQSVLPQIHLCSSLSLSPSRTSLCSCFKSPHHPSFTLTRFLYSHSQNIHSSLSNLLLVPSHLFSLYAGLFPAQHGQKYVDITPIQTSWMSHPNTMTTSICCCPISAKTFNKIGQILLHHTLKMTSWYTLLCSVLY